MRKALFLSLLVITPLIFSGCLGKKDVATDISTPPAVSKNKNTSADSTKNANDDTNASANINIASTNTSLSNANANVSVSETNTNPAAVTNTNASEEDTVADENASTSSETAAADPDARKRDDQRIADVTSLRDALKKHFDEKSSYPDNFDGLVPGYLSALPKNPTPGGRDYNYTPIGSLPAKFYDLSYELEVGTDEVSAGGHVATPDGIAQP